VNLLDGHVVVAFLDAAGDLDLWERTPRGWR
jgi:hypothetical protein